jgi:hypothetical protein
MREEMVMKVKPFVLVVFCVFLSIVFAACSSVPLIQRSDPNDRLKGLVQESENIRSLGERYWLRSLNFWDKNEIYKKMKASAKNLGDAGRNDADAAVRQAAKKHLEDLYQNENPLIRLVAFREVQDQEIIRKAALYDKLLEVRCIAASRLKDPAVLTELSRADDAAGRIARLKLGLMDPVVVKTFSQEPVLSVETETRLQISGPVKREGYFTNFVVQSGDQVLIKGGERLVIKGKADAKATKTQSGETVYMLNFGYPIGAGEIISKASSAGKTGSYGEKFEIIDQLDLAPVFVLFNMMVNSNFPVGAATEIVHSTNSSDLKNAAIRYLKMKK